MINKKIVFLLMIFLSLLNSQEKELKPVLANQNLIIDSDNSSLRWLGGLKYNVNDHYGFIKIKNGKINLNEDKKITGRIVVDMKSISNEDVESKWKQNLVNHLKSPDFFDVQKYSESFIQINSSKIIRKLENENYLVQIDAELTIKSIVNRIRFEAIIDFDSTTKNATGKMVFDRNDFEIQYRSEMHIYDPDSFWNKLESTRATAMDKVIKDEIEIIFDIKTKEEFLHLN